MLVCSEMGEQGLSKLDWTTLWLPPRNWNWTMSPTSALTLSGEKARVPFVEPTEITHTFCAEATPIRAKRAAVENCILAVFNEIPDFLK